MVATVNKEWQTSLETQRKKPALKDVVASIFRFLEHDETTVQSCLLSSRSMVRIHQGALVTPRVLSDPSDPKQQNINLRALFGALTKSSAQRFTKQCSTLFRRFKALKQVQTLLLRSSKPVSCPINRQHPITSENLSVATARRVVSCRVLRMALRSELSMTAHGKRNTAVSVGCIAWLLLSLPVAGQTLDDRIEELMRTKQIPRSVIEAAKRGALSIEMLEGYPDRAPQKPPSYPFSPTPNGFKQWLRGQGVRVISVSDCWGTQLGGMPNLDGSTGPNQDIYKCNRVFFDSTDPRGTQRCMGGFYWSNYVGLREDTYKNDCRWL